MKKGPFTPFGATGQFPRGKLHESDEGEIRIGVTVKSGTVVLAFGKDVSWVGMPPRQARDLGRMLIARADEAAQAQ